ncbi:MAG: hypothetical protein ACYC6Y_13660 [Thermoguttaceae bacterium]
MGRLARFLQGEFEACCPAGWRCRCEVPVVSRECGRLLGFVPRADVVLERDDGGRRLWVELEVSRADPAANHVKYATAHLFEPQAGTDAFVAMVSSHVSRGRRNLAAGAILVMRRIGMRAWQTVLLPQLAPAEIRRLNELGADALRGEAIDAGAELERAIQISEPAAAGEGYRIDFAGDWLEVVSNLVRWNRELETEAGRMLWRKRRVQYFVHDRRTGLFAPAKFCAFLDASGGGGESGWAVERGMTMALYTSLDESEPRFDGNRAQVHLVRQLGMTALAPGDRPGLEEEFARWVSVHEDFVTVDGRGARILVPPAWWENG